MNRKSKVFQSAVPVAFVGLSAGLCPVFDDKESDHTEVEQHQPVSAFGRGAVAYVSSATTNVTVRLTGVETRGYVGTLSPSIWKANR